MPARTRGREPDGRAGRGAGGRDPGHHETDEFDVSSNGKCSLRAAIEAAINDDPKGGCPTGSGADVVQIPARRYELTIVSGPENSGSYLNDRRDLDGRRYGHHDPVRRARGDDHRRQWDRPGAAGG